MTDATHFHGWVNLYKPKGISSAKAVAIIKRAVKPAKVGHAGTLDLEAEGILPIAVGEATKLTSILMQAKKTYEFTIQFGAKTDSADAAGNYLAHTNYIPSEQACRNIIAHFTGKISQTPPIYSALKIGGKRAYALARLGEKITIPSREVTIYQLDYLAYDQVKQQASYRCVCSKGTYIRSLAEDISLGLQSLGFVVELRRLKVGIFSVDTAITIDEIIKSADNITNKAATQTDLQNNSLQQLRKLLQEKSLGVEEVLDDIPALAISDEQEQAIRYGQNCYLATQLDNINQLELIWLKNREKLVAIGHLQQGFFKSSRVFNL